MPVKTTGSLVNGLARTCVLLMHVRMCFDLDGQQCWASVEGVSRDHAVMLRQVAFMQQVQSCTHEADANTVRDSRKAESQRPDAGPEPGPLYFCQGHKGALQSL